MARKRGKREQRAIHAKKRKKGKKYHGPEYGKGGVSPGGKHGILSDKSPFGEGQITQGKEVKMGKQKGFFQ
jgi:hypothetical protein